MKLTVFWSNLGNSIVYYPKLAKVTGGVTAVVFLFHILEYQSQLNNPHQWIRFTVNEIANQTGLTQVEQELAKQQLIKRSLLQERLVDGASELMEFWVNIDQLEQILNSDFPNNDHIESPSLNTNIEQLRKDSSVQNLENTSAVTRIIKSDKFFPVQRQPIAVKITPNYQFSGPWHSNEEFEEFQKVLLEYAKYQGFESPSGWVFKIIDGITKGLVSPFWEEFISGIPLGASQKIHRDWEIQPGIPYPAFEEERINYYSNKGEPFEVALSKARSDLRNPVLAQDLWEGFLRKCDRLADNAIKDKNAGVTSPYLPPSFTNRGVITKESVMNKLAAISSTSSTANIPDLKSPVMEEQKLDIKEYIPDIVTLQKMYKTALGKTLVSRQIEEHPEWGYGIIDGEVIDLVPF